MLPISLCNRITISTNYLQADCFVYFYFKQLFQNIDIDIKEMNKRQIMNKFRRFSEVFMSSITDFECQSKNRNVESQWKFQGQSALQNAHNAKK